MVALTAKANIGVCEGYNHDNDTTLDFPKFVQDFVNKYCEESGTPYVSFIVYETFTIYKQEWGCPIGGEKTYNLESTINREFFDSIVDWKKNVTSIVTALKRELKQSTVMLTFHEAEANYITD